MATHSRFDDQLREAVDACGLSHYAICNATGISPGNFSRFMHRTGGMSLGNINKVCKLIGARLVAGKPKVSKPKRQSRGVQS